MGLKSVLLLREDFDPFSPLFPLFLSSFVSFPHQRLSMITSDISTDDGLDRKDAKLLDEHGASLELRTVLLDLSGHLSKIGGDQVVGQNILEVRKPEDADLRQQLSLVGDALFSSVTSLWLLFPKRLKGGTRRDKRCESR